MACTCTPKSSKMCDSCLRASPTKIIGRNVRENGQFTLNQVDVFQKQFEDTIFSDLQNNPLSVLVKKDKAAFYDSLNTINNDFLKRPYIIAELEKEDNAVISERLTHGPITAIEFATFLTDSNYTAADAVSGPTGCNANGPRFVRELNDYYNGDFSDSVLGGFCSLFGNIFGAIGAFFDILGKVDSLIKDALEFIAKIRNIKDPLKALFDAIKVKALIEAIKEKIAKMIEKTIEKVKAMIENFNPVAIMENIKSAIQTKILDRIVDIKNDIMLFFSKENIERIKDKIKGIIDYCIGLFDNPSLEEIQFLIARICAFAAGIEGLIKGLKSPLDDFSNRYQEVFNTLENSGNRVTGAAIQSGALRYTSERVQQEAENTQRQWEDTVPGTPSPIRPEELAGLPTWDEFRSGQVPWIAPPGGGTWMTRPQAAPNHEGWTLLKNDVKVRVQRLHVLLQNDGLINGSPFVLLSGYRSQRYNDWLRNRRRNSGVATHSKHIQRIAVDLTHPSLSGNGWRDWQRVRRHCLAVGFGGIALYRSENFFHCDKGAVRRSWTGE